MIDAVHYKQAKAILEEGAASTAAFNEEKQKSGV
jgi:hypothetical protein